MWVVSTSTKNLTDRLEQGFKMLALGNDSGLLLRSIHQSLREIGRDRSLATSIDPIDGQLESSNVQIGTPLEKVQKMLSKSDAIKDNTFMNKKSPKGK